MQYLNAGLYPVSAPLELVFNWRGKLPIAILSEITEQYRHESLRSLAKEYGVSHEAVRRTIKRLPDF